MILQSVGVCLTHRLLSCCTLRARRVKTAISSIAHEARSARTISKPPRASVTRGRLAQPQQWQWKEADAAAARHGNLPRGGLRCMPFVHQVAACLAVMPQNVQLMWPSFLLCIILRNSRHTFQLQSLSLLKRPRLQLKQPTAPRQKTLNSKASWCVRSGVIVASNGLSPAACASGACPLAAKHKRFPDGSGLGASWQRCWNTLLVGCSVFTYRGGSFDCHAAGRRCGASPLRFVVARCILPSITNNMHKANCNPCHSSSRWIAARPVCASRFRRWSLPVSTTGRADLRGSWYCRALVSA